VRRDVRGMKDLTDIESNRVSQSKSTIDDVTSTEEEAAWKIAEGLGVRVDRCRSIVDAYGANHALAALTDVQGQIKAGKQLKSPIAVMVANLRSGAVQVKVAEVDPGVEWVRERYHNAQADPTRETALRQKARYFGDKTLRCGCGCGQEFPV
jgi:hypothetical protein